MWALEALPGSARQANGGPAGSPSASPASTLASGHVPLPVPPALVASCSDDPLALSTPSGFCSPSAHSHHCCLALNALCRQHLVWPLQDQLGPYLQGRSACLGPGSPLFLLQPAQWLDQTPPRRRPVSLSTPATLADMASLESNQCHSQDCLCMRARERRRGCHTAAEAPSGHWAIPRWNIRTSVRQGYRDPSSPPLLVPSRSQAGGARAWTRTRAATPTGAACTRPPALAWSQKWPDHILCCDDA